MLSTYIVLHFIYHIIMKLGKLDFSPSTITLSFPTPHAGRFKPRVRRS